MWAHVMTNLATDPSVLWRECDWVAKLRLIEGYQARHGLGMGSPKVALVELMYHDIDRRRGLFYKLQAAGQVDRTTSDAAIKEAMVSPPSTTRARLRGAGLQHVCLSAQRGEPASPAHAGPRATRLMLSAASARRRW